MARFSRLCGLVLALGAMALALVVARAAQSEPVGAAAQAAPADPAAPARQRVKPSDPPHLGLFFTDQVVGYIQPCG